MLTLYGRTYPVVTVLDEVLGRGGQGTVRPTKTPPDLAVKFPTDRHQVEKAEVMVGLTAPAGCRAWPLDVLSQQPGGEPEAILMERVPGVSWFVLATPDARARAGLQVVLRDLVLGVCNLWLAIANLHRRRVWAGDLQPHNVLVDPADGYAVHLVDLDSSEFEARGRDHVFRRWRSGVGLPGYLAPELIGKDLRATDRTAASDCFAGTILSWEALKAGSHSHGWGNPAGGPVPDASDAIRDRLWPFDPAVRPPAGCVPVDAGTPFADLPPRVRRLFHDTFTAADPARRPSADECREAFDGWLRDLDGAAVAAGVIRGAVGRVARHLARLNALRMAAPAVAIHRPLQIAAVDPRRPTRGRGRAAVAAGAVAAAAAGGVYVVGGSAGVFQRAVPPPTPADVVAPTAATTEPTDPRWRDPAVPALWRELVAEAEREGVR